MFGLIAGGARLGACGNRGRACAITLEVEHLVAAAHFASPLLALPFCGKPLFMHLRSRRHVTPLTRELVVDTLNVRVSRHYCDTLAFLCLPQTFLSPVAHIANTFALPQNILAAVVVWTVDTSILTQHVKSERRRPSFQSPAVSA